MVKISNLLVCLKIKNIIDCQTDGQTDEEIDTPSYSHFKTEKYSKKNFHSQRNQWQRMFSRGIDYQHKAHLGSYPDQKILQD